METEEGSSHTYETLLQMCIENKEYFDKEEKSQKLCVAFGSLEEQIVNILPLVTEFRNSASSYDFRNVPANGYRSYIQNFDKMANLCITIVRNVNVKRKSLFFQKTHYIREIEECARAFASFSSCFEILRIIKSGTNSGELFLNKIDKIVLIEECISKMDFSSFFGRFLAFQYDLSMQSMVKSIAIMMTAFAEYYYNDKNFIQCASLCSQLFVNQEKRAEQLAQMVKFETMSAEFYQKLWNTTEHYANNLFNYNIARARLVENCASSIGNSKSFKETKAFVRKMNSLLSPSSAVNELIKLPSTPIQCETKNGDKVEIPVPTVYVGAKPLYTRLISCVKREGMALLEKDLENGSNVQPASDWLVLHLHGGGFISQTSESHQIYLKEWAKCIEAPILSVDYSLAPQAPFPRAIDDVLFAYAWLLNNLKSLGTTGKRIVFAGDSAGGNLCLSLTLKCIDLNIRIPDGIFLAYCPTVLQFYPCPSRLLGLLDPIFSYGVLLCCTRAYVYPRRLDEIEESLDGIETSPVSSNDAQLNSESVSLRSTANVLPESEKNGLPDLSTDPLEDLSLPSKYKIAIKGFFSNLKQKLNSSKHQKDHSRPHSVDPNVTSMEQLILEVQDNRYLSPLFAEDRYFENFPPTSIVTVEMDPCVDDCVMFAKKLDKLQVPIELDVLKNLTHGFLNSSQTSKEAYNGSMFCAERIKALLNGTFVHGSSEHDS